MCSWSLITKRGWWIWKKPTCMIIRYGTKCTRPGRRTTWRHCYRKTGTICFKDSHPIPSSLISTTSIFPISFCLSVSNIFLFVARHYWKNSPVRPPCDPECKKRMLCDLRSGKSHDRKLLCQELESRIDAKTRTGWRAWFYNGIALSYVNSTNFNSKPLKRRRKFHPLSIAFSDGFNNRRKRSWFVSFFFIFFLVPSSEFNYLR